MGAALALSLTNWAMLGALVWYGTFRLDFHPFDRFELDLRGHTQP